MASKITITTTDTTTTVSSPYHPDWAPRAKMLDGQWRPAIRAWQFDARDEAAVRDLAREIYGTDGDDQSASETVTVRVALDKMPEINDQTTRVWRMFGRLIAERPSRDQAVRLGRGVILVEGEFARSAGSTRFPDLGAYGVVVEVRDIPAGHADLDHAAVTRVETRVDRDALTAEREQLVARLAEIDALLDDTQPTN